MAQTKKTGGMDLSALAEASETSVMTVYEPATGQPFTDDNGDPMWIELHSMDSARYKQVQNQQTNMRIQQAQRSRGQATITAEQQEANSLALLAKCTKSWHVVMNGEALECSEKNAKWLYEQIPAVREQADAFMHDRKNFLKNSSAT